MPEFARIQSCSLFWRPQQVDDEKMRGKWRSIILIPSRQKETSVLSFHQHRKYRRNCATTIKSSPPRPPPLHFYDCRAILCTTSFFFILLSYTSVMEAAGRMLSHRYLVNYWKNFCVRYYVCGSSSFGKWAASLKETTSARIIKKKKEFGFHRFGSTTTSSSDTDRKNGWIHPLFVLRFFSLYVSFGAAAMRGRNGRLIDYYYDRKREKKKEEPENFSEWQFTVFGGLGS